MNRSLFETILGAVVLVAAAIFMWFAYSVADINTGGGYEVSASFNKVGGLTSGNDVRISGVKIGSVRGIDLNQETYQADVMMDIRQNVPLPVDSMAQVATEGLLGGYYLQITPGVEEEFITNGGSLAFTQPPVDFLDLLGRFIFSQESGSDGDQSNPSGGL